MNRALPSCLVALSVGFGQFAFAPPRIQAEEVEAKPKPVQFARDIRPLLSENCYACHGPDAKKREADLRFDLEDAAKADRGGYQAIVPGNSSESEMYLRVSAEDPEFRMPPTSSGHALKPDEIELLRRWIDEGAEWQGHWSLIPPVRPGAPAVTDSSWPRNAIDTFILARLEAEGLAPSPEADRRTLIRRVTLDLTGLPPEPIDVEAFVNDSSADAYDKVVDRLLRSPEYGEHMARYWLDAARYGDTHGLHLDNYREMWPYRDWVIGAFNANMPFDQFALEQLAGDLLPNATVSQQIASGFNRCNVTTAEGGSIEEEVYVRNVVDRVETTSTVYMGLTLGCAVCHDHKFDPFTQKDFYQLFAFFNNLDDKPLDGNRKDHAPVIRLPEPDQQAALDRMAASLASTNEAIKARETAARPVFDDWLIRAATDPQAVVRPLAGLIAAYPLDESVANSVDPERPGAVEGSVAWVDGKSGKGLRFGDQGYVELGDVGRFERTQPFSFGAWIKTDGEIMGSPISRIDAEGASRGYELQVSRRKIAVHLVHDWQQSALRVQTEDEVLTPNQWHHVLVTYDGSSQGKGVTLYVDGKARKLYVSVDSLSGTINTDAPLRLGRGRAGASFAKGEIDDVRFYYRRLASAEAASLFEGDAIRAIVQVPEADRTDEQRDKLWKHYLVQFDDPYKQLAGEKERLEKQKSDLEGRITTTLVSKERAEPRPAYVLVRGQYDHQGEGVERVVPAALPPLADDLPRDRLGFVRWLLSPAHPLTARVTVNRFWQQCFGTGIVKTSEDFGSQGQWPSHPDLLDWLAVDFRETGWDVKRLMKLIVTSATYRQSGRVRPDLLERDPDNRLLARGPRYRLDAETLRDQALAVSGLLVRTEGGPGVKPPQPAGIWEAVGYTASNTAKFKQDTGAAIYRRSVYTFWKRTAPPPTMTVFDAPSRESCRVRRERTNTPLQALVTMNEQQFFESARHLARRTLRATSGDPEQRLATLFERATSRPPDAEELEGLLELYRANLAEYQANPEAAKQVIHVGGLPPDASLDPGELAAWTMVANLVLNLDEVLTKN
jgi:hypothetical protein